MVRLRLGQREGGGHASRDNDEGDTAHAARHRDSAATIHHHVAFCKDPQAMGSLDCNVHLQSDFVSYLNDAPFLQGPIIGVYKPSSNTWICRCRIRVILPIL